jgi:4-hydroxy-tetrahydrodipicolinate reductase
MGQQLVEATSKDPNLILAATVSRNEIKAFDAEHTAVLKHSQSALCAVIQGADVVIDFSAPTATLKLAKALESASDKTVLIGTTGLSSKEIRALSIAAKRGRHRILIAGNTSLGVATLAKLIGTAVTALSDHGFDIEIIEAHHRMKKDAPSGTALFLAEIVKRANPKLKVINDRKGPRQPHTFSIHAIRGGGIIGEHEIRLISDHEEISLGHRAFNRSLFAKGALTLAHDIHLSLKPGCCLDLADYISSTSHQPDF